MPLLINKDGKQLGPYSLEEARALVLSGELDADDWAWPDGATDWVHLKNVPNFTPATSAKPAAPGSALTEEILWEGHPSQIFNLHIYLSWAIILAAMLAAAFVFAAVMKWLLILFGVLAVVALGQITWVFFHLRSVKYVISTQRVRIVSGLLSKDIQEIELFRVKDTMAHQSFLLRLFGLGTITVVSGDERHPRLVLSGVPQAIELRERLRQEVMTLRQRFGVRELDVM